MSAPRDRVSLDEYRADLERFGERPVIWQFDITTAMALIGRMQLALRHPQYRGPSAEVARAQITAFRDALPEEFPAIKKLITQGFNSQYDADEAG